MTSKLNDIRLLPRLYFIFQLTQKQYAQSHSDFPESYHGYLHQASLPIRNDPLLCQSAKTYPVVKEHKTPCHIVTGCKPQLKDFYPI